MATSTEAFERVDCISGPGDYRFASDPNTPHRYDGGAVFNDSIGHLDRPDFNNDILEYLKQEYPVMGSRRFIPWSVVGDVYTPSRLKEIESFDPSLYFHGTQYIVVNGEVCAVAINSSSSNGAGDWSFSIKDVKLSVVQNQLRVAQPKGRNGMVRIDTLGEVAHFHRPTGRSWRTFIDVDGENPGLLVRETIDWINQLKAERGLPLWKKID